MTTQSNANYIMELQDEIEHLRFQRDALIEALKVRGVSDDFIRTLITVTIHTQDLRL